MSSFNLEDIKKYLREKVMEQLDISRSMEDDEVKEIIDDCIMEMSREQYISTWEKDRIAREIFFSIRKLDILQELIEDSEITEIMVNGTESIFVERAGRNEKLKVHFQDKEKLEDVIQQIVAKSNRVVNESNPIVDARLENGSRVNVVLSSVAINGPILTIRRFPEKPINMERLIQIHSITKEAAAFLQRLVVAGYNIFISGGTGSGKTTFLNALSNYIPSDERIITIEDSAELRILGIENLVRLETRNANVEGCREISIRDLIRSSLRMRPDRIIVGEVRGAEAIDMIQALNTGHDGSLSTGHANSAKDMISRLETMILMGMSLPLEAIRRQIASGIDIIIHLGRLRDKSRKVLQIAEVMGYADGEVVLNSLYEYKEGRDEDSNEQQSAVGTLVRCGELINTQKLLSKGL